MECIICLDSNTCLDNNLQSLHCKNCGDKNKWIHKKCFDNLKNHYIENDISCPLCRATLDMSIKIKKIKVNSKNNKNNKIFTIVNISRETTNVYLNNEFDNEIIIKKGKFKCIKDLISLEDKSFLFIFFSTCFIIIFALFYIIFCKKESSVCYNCILVSIILSILLSVLFVNYYIKLDKENKIKSKILKWISWGILSFGFTTLLSFTKKDDCSQDYHMYFAILVINFLCGFCCIKYNKKSY